MHCVFWIVAICLRIGILEGRRNARLIEELDIEQEIINMKNEINGLKAENKILRNQIGSTYVRWGRTTCPQNGTSLVYSGLFCSFKRFYLHKMGRTTCPGNGTTLVYSGYMAGTYHDRSRGPGSGANYLCLAGQPTWDHYSETVNNIIRITGVQYEFYAHTQVAHDLQAFFGADVHDSEAPCSVCRSPRSTTVMIPGRKDCYSGWNKEYSGYLVGAYSGYDDASEYVCLDRQPETVVHSGNSDDDNMLYFVEATCGKSLECPPYIHDRELACVVCSL